MGIKETPVNFRVYYTSMKRKYTKLKEDNIEHKETLLKEIDKLQTEISKTADNYKKEFNVELDKIEEFKQNKYIDGKFLKLAKGLFINRKNDYVLTSELYSLLTLANNQKAIHDIDVYNKKYDKILNLKLSEYNELLRVFYTEVHKHLILNGEGYKFDGHLGWTCINRVKVSKPGSKINYVETKRNKERLIAEGKKIYDETEAKWCERNGLDYDGVDYRVFMENEYYYEYPLINCTLEDGRKYKLKPTNYIGSSIRNKTNEDMIKESNGNKEYICELPLDIRRKLNICIEIDKTLYLNFIRNENQKSINATKADR